MSKAEELIACLEGEIAKRDARIAELENDASYYAARYEDQRAELAALKTQEPVAFDVYDNDSDQLAHTVRADDAKRVAHYRASPGAWRLIPLYAAPVSEAKAQGVVMPEGWIPLTIEHEPGYPEDVAFGPKRMMDRLKKWLDRYFEMRLNAAPSPAGVEGLDVSSSGWFSLVMNAAAELETASYSITDSDAKLVAQSGADYYRSKAKSAQVVCLPDAQAIIDGLRGEVGQQAQRIGELEGLLREVAASLAWNAHGECRAIHDGPIMPSQMAIDAVKAALGGSL